MQDIFLETGYRVHLPQKGLIDNCGGLIGGECMTLIPASDWLLVFSSSLKEVVAVETDKIIKKN